MMWGGHGGWRLEVGSQFPEQESNPDCGSESAKSSPLDHQGLAARSRVLALAFFAKGILAKRWKKEKLVNTCTLYKSVSCILEVRNFYSYKISEG